MTPAARVAAAIAILERSLAGTPTEQALTNWARASRYAGSGDRAAVRDHVYTAIRCRRSHAALGGEMSGRGLLLGQLREVGHDLSSIFNGSQYAPQALTAAEATHLEAPGAMARNVALDCPDWLASDLEASLGAEFVPVMQALRQRAPVFLRVNAARCSLAEAQAILARDGITAHPNYLAKTALEVTEKARKIHLSTAYRDGLVELQDAASQAAAARLPVTGEMRVLDYCAGGGGKALALAAMHPQARIYAHDSDAARMSDLPERARRAGADIHCLTPGEAREQAPFDLVLVDVPCSGSGAWRRAPDGKWRLDRRQLDDLRATQAEILRQSAPLVAPGGCLAYMTCSLLDDENTAQSEIFVRQSSSWSLSGSWQFSPAAGGDGFFIALLTRV